ncbi:Anaphase-promoting complex subunit 10 [Colletotrichum chlorophyti]|uniref:Anaphase-promoting complex subunit 10 n=1 Tax=Colletotrichum chlorophyti TaxID=708187 RepID=A0A1Q8RQZ7_9PEZI|nr:Anaphase-promoting complex subunit 10 [Colletotrichum chlorophyti]
MEEHRRTNINSTRRQLNLQTALSPLELSSSQNGLDLDFERGGRWMNDYYDRRATRNHGPNGSQRDEDDSDDGEAFPPQRVDWAAMRAGANMDDYLRNAQIPEYSDEEMPEGMDGLGEISGTDTSVEDGDIEDQAEDHHDEPDFDPLAAGLKEISNLGKFTVSSHKQGNGVEQLRNDSLKTYWQSDGPQPHKLTVYFIKRVGIRNIRFYVDYNEDESYTPTKIIFKSGTSENNLIQFATMELSTPVGWQQVPVAGAGGGPDGNTLVSYVFQMQVLENHQNGKDTHLRSIKIYAADTESTNIDHEVGNREAAREEPDVEEPANPWDLSVLEAGLSMPDFMKDPEIR